MEIFTPLGVWSVYSVMLGDFVTAYLDIVERETGWSLEICGSRLVMAV
jgi:hypothetical protein